MSQANGHPADPAERNECRSARSAVDVSKQWSADVAHVYQVRLKKVAEVVPPADVEDEVIQGSSAAEDIRSPSFEEDFPPLDDEYLRECLGEYPDFLYHIARNKYGDVYFRVVRSLLLDKGIVLRIVMNLQNFVC